ncbi:hypothetical protein HK405_003514, partial [Cladochytrium tenue]
MSTATVANGQSTDGEFTRARLVEAATLPGLVTSSGSGDTLNGHWLKPENLEAESQKENIPGAQSPPTHQLDGGAVAWLQVAAVFSVSFNTWGILNTFGVFQTYYESGALFSETSSNISWIGAVQSGCVILLGLISGPLFDRGYLRVLVALGVFLIVFGFMMLSISSTYWQALLAQGFCVGIGGGLIFMPAMAILPQYFRSKMGLAIGLAMSGSSIGGVLYPIIFYKLIAQIGFAWSVRTIAFIAFATLLLPAVALQTPTKKPAGKPRDALDWSAFTDGPFLFFTANAIIGYLGLYVVLFYISYFAGTAGVASNEMSFYIVPILNAGSLFGRTIPNALSDVVGPFNLFGPASIVCAILTFCLIPSPTLGGVVAIALLYGFFSGAMIALPAVCFVHLTPDKTKIGTRLGMGIGVASLGMLAGGPSAGAILGSDPADLKWTDTWIYGGCTMLASGVLMIVLRFWVARGKLFAK